MPPLTTAGALSRRLRRPRRGRGFCASSRIRKKGGPLHTNSRKLTYLFHWSSCDPSSNADYASYLGRRAHGRIDDGVFGVAAGGHCADVPAYTATRCVLPTGQRRPPGATDRPPPRLAHLGVPRARLRVLAVPRLV